MIVEVESNENCDTSFFAPFKEAGPAQIQWSRFGCL